jgi:hypothetical protein
VHAFFSDAAGSTHASKASNIVSWHCGPTPTSNFLFQMGLLIALTEESVAQNQVRDHVQMEEQADAQVEEEAAPLAQVEEEAAPLAAGPSRRDEDGMLVAAAVVLVLVLLQLLGQQSAVGPVGPAGPGSAVRPV